MTRVTGYKDPRKFGGKTEWPLSPPVTPHHQRPVMVNPGASRSFVACDSDDYVPHGPGDRADSFDNAGSLHVALAAARPVHTGGTVRVAPVTAATDQHLSTATTTQEKSRGRPIRLGQTWTKPAMGGIVCPHVCTGTV